MLSETKLGAPLAPPVLDELASAGEILDLVRLHEVRAAGEPHEAAV